MTKNDAPTFTPIVWNASGTQMAYGKMPQRSYAVEVHLTEAVKGELLQAALDKALERLPYYRQTIIRKKGLYYYAENDLPFEVAEHDGTRPMGGATNNYHMVDITYFGNKIDFAMWHVFCDGLGLNRLIEAVLYHYMCMKDGVTYDATGIITDAIPYDAAEEYDPHMDKRDVDTKELKELASYEGRFHLPEIDEPAPDYPMLHRLPLKIKTEDLLTWSKANGSSPAAAVSAIMAKGIAAEHDVEGTVMSVMPASLRKYVNAEKSFKNCSIAFFAPMKAEDVKSMSAGELAREARTVMKSQMNQHMADQIFGGINMLIHLGAKLPFFWLKTKVLAIAENRPQDTFLVDYVGGLTANGYADQIADVRYLNSVHFPGVTVLMSETAGHFHINFNQTFESDRYFKAFCAILDEQGIPYEVLERDSYLNPKIEMPQEQK